jgi:proline iminopeptidase
LQEGTTVQKLNIAMQWQLAERRLLGLPAMDRQGHQTWRQRIAALRKFRLQAHYLYRRAGLGKSALLMAAARIGRREVPVTLLHGRADRVCRPGNAVRLHATMPQARLVWVQGGHLAAGEMAQALRAAIRTSGWSVVTRRLALGFVDPAVDGIA